jgi:CRISPR-associated endonuclease Csn1
MELCSSRYTLADELDKLVRDYYATNPSSIEDRMKEMYVSSAVKRQIYRALDVVKTVKKVMGHSPEKIFVEMARGGTPEQKGKRTQTRLDQLLEKYRHVRDEEVKEINAELVSMGDGAHNRLQSDALYLWYLQLGRCAYCGKSLAIENLKVEADIDHIHPQSLVKDDSILNNKVLTCKKCNGEKRDQYPIPEELRQEDLWQYWHRKGLMTEEKFRRLMRRDALTDADKQGFINRQLVETRQTTKAVFTILKDLLPDTELIAVKAGNVSDVRQHFRLTKCRSLNDLHHAKDAYLNIIVGNVYHEKFTRNFSFSQNYSMKVSALFGDRKFENSCGIIWDGIETIDLLKATMSRNDIHLTKFQYYVGGGFFDQMPLAAGRGEISRKAKLLVEKYGGYAKSAATGFVLARYETKKGREVILVPIRLLDKNIITGSDIDAAVKLVEQSIRAVDSKFLKLVDFPIGRRLLRVNTRFNFDDYVYVVAGKSGGGKDMIVRSLTPFILTAEDESYIKRLESMSEKMRKNKKIQVDEKYDKISVGENCKLYDRIISAASSFFNNVPSSQLDVLKCGREAFANLDILEQIKTLMQVVQLYKTNRAGASDLTGIKGARMAGVLILGTKFSNLKKRYSRVCLVDMDFTGIYSRESVNLLDLI